MKKVLVVEDDKIWQSILFRIISELGNEVMTASEGLEGLLKALKERPDVLIVDHVLPKINGAHIIRFLRENPDFRQTGMVIITSHEEMMNEYWAKEFGADIFISKLEGIDSVREELEEFLKGDFKTFKTSKSEINVSLESILNILDEDLRHEKLNRDILSLVEFVEDEEYIMRKIWATINDFVDVESMYILMLTPAMGRVYAFSNEEKSINALKLRNSLLKLMIRPITPSSWIYKGSVKFEESGSVPDYTLTFSLEFHGSELGLVGFEGAPLESRRILLSLYKDLSNSLGALVHTLNVFWENKIASTIDSLTGLYVKKVIMDKLRELISLSSRNKLTFSVVMMDIDDFKKINDTYGHTVGDVVLREIGRLIKTSIRETDHAGRYGGEEFLILLPGTDSKGAEIVIGRLLERIRSNDWRGVTGYNMKVTMSAGIAEGKPGLSVIETIDMADKALYEAKRSGKDKYVVYGGD